MADLKDFKGKREDNYTEDYPEIYDKKCGIEYCIKKDTCNQIQIPGILKEEKVKCINYKTVLDG